MAPTEFLLKWSEQDRGLAVGLHVVEETTGLHGYPLELETDADQDGYFKVVPEVNFAQRALDIYREQNTKPEPGETVRVIYDRET